jgi:hypothetical protein
LNKWFNYLVTLRCKSQEGTNENIIEGICREISCTCHPHGAASGEGGSDAELNKFDDILGDDRQK